MKPESAVLEIELQTFCKLLGYREGRIMIGPKEPHVLAYQNYSRDE
jgi:hypothetical protein